MKLSNKWLRFYFSFKGRATRYDFNVRFGFVILLGFVAAGMLDMAFSGEEIAQRVTFFSKFWMLVTLAPTFAVSARRLHDMNAPGWWVVPFVALPGGYMLYKMILFSPEELENISVSYVFGVLGLLVLYLVFFLNLSMKRGTIGANKYGPDPLRQDKITGFSKGH